jgi:hypothetical protein
LRKTRPTNSTSRSLYGHSALSHIPHAHFGDLLSVDRQEIETLRSLTQLIQRYEREKQPKQPLSIAAFGPPGAGKSFGIKEIARQILGKDVPILEFNLSQFDSASGLFGAFHQVRDKALKGFIPVVFWDEFDSRNYHWLQYLLAPMQDGTFEENGHTHTIGKCLFVFAGGTSWDFEHFGPAPMPEAWQPAFLRPLRRKSGDVPAADPAPEPGGATAAKNEQADKAPAAAGSAPEPGSAAAQLVEFYRNNHDRIVADQTASDDFRRKKGPDFLSRLDGHIDVLGPNQRRCYDWATRSWDAPDPHDITFPIRRALLLRQFLGAREPKDSLAIDRDLLRAFLQVPRYRHGVRSLEKIARQLVLSRPPFRRAALPSPQVLTQHLVSVEAFEDIYQDTQRLLTPQAIDALANAIDEGYNHDNPGGWNRTFKDLEPFLQQSNRAAALRIPYILALAGLCLMVRQKREPKLKLDDQFTAEEQAVSNHIAKHLEVLAEEEHRLWIQFHEENGWTFGFKLKPEAKSDDPSQRVVPFEKDKANLKHPCLKPFHDMPDDHGQRKTWQDYDRNAVRRYPRILRLTDFAIAFTKA